MDEAIVLQMQAADALIVKEIRFGEVKTQSFVDGKPGYIDRKDIKRLGYRDAADLVQHLKAQGYKEL